MDNIATNPRNVSLKCARPAPINRLASVYEVKHCLARFEKQNRHNVLLCVVNLVLQSKMVWHLRSM